MHAPLVEIAPPLNFSRKFFYALPSFGINGAGYVVAIYVNKVYADDLNVSLGFLSIASFLAGVFAMYGQFVIAFMSDSFTKSRLGRRRPFFLILAPLMAVAYFFLLFPVGADTRISASIYFGIFFVAQSLLADGLTTLYSSFLNEQTSDPSERGALFGAQGMLSVAGVVSAAVIAFALPERERLLVLGSVFGGITLITFYLIAWKGREPRFVEVHQHNRGDIAATKGYNPLQSEIIPLVPGLRMCLLNGPWRRFICMFAVMSLLNELPGIYPFFLQYELDVKSEDVYTWIGIWVVVYCICAMVSIPVYVFILKRWGKMTVLYTGCSLLVIHGVMFFFVRTPEIGIAAVMFMGLSMGSFNILNGLFLSEIIDYDELLSGRRREGLYNAITTIPQRFMSVSGKAFPLLGLASLGYQPNVEQNMSVKIFLRSLIGLIPVCMGIGSMLIMRNFPLSDSKHKEVMEAITRRRDGEVVLDPVLGVEMKVLQSESNDLGQHEWTLHHFGYDQLHRAQRWGRRFLTQEVGINLLIFIAASIGCLVEAGFLLYYNGDKQVAVDIAFVLVFLGCFFSACGAYSCLQFQASKAIQHLEGYELVLTNHLKNALRASFHEEIEVANRGKLMCRIVFPRLLLLALIVVVGGVAVAESDLLPVDSTNTTAS